MQPSHEYRIMCQINCLISNEMMFNHEINAWGIILCFNYLTVKSVLQTAATLNVQLHSWEGLNTLTVKCYRRRVWETRHLGVTGWELLSHFSDVWFSSLLQLTRGSNWQQESLFRCQMWPHWTYVPNSIIRKGNNSRWTWFHIILYVP